MKLLFWMAILLGANFLWLAPILQENAKRPMTYWEAYLGLWKWAAIVLVALGALQVVGFGDRL